MPVANTNTTSDSEIKSAQYQAALIPANQTKL